jgi:hypothetical protein
MKHLRAFVISLVMLGLVALTACAVAMPNEVEVALTACAVAMPNEVEQPETDRATAEGIETAAKDEGLTDSTFYADNPELLVVDRYAGVADEAQTGSAFYAANPELMAAHHPAAVLEAESVSPYEGVDPLQRLVRCCYSTEKWMGSSSYLAANPELSVAGRYENAGIDETGTDDALYAANPELMIADRYTAAQEEKLRPQ